jgi:hypothetical protein
MRAHTFGNLRSGLPVAWNQAISKPASMLQTFGADYRAFVFIRAVFWPFVDQIPSSFLAASRPDRM